MTLMPNRSALDEGEQRDEKYIPVPSSIATSPSTPIRTRIAWYLSNIFSPVVISLPFIILVALYHARTLPLTLGYAALTFLFLTIGPTIYILTGVLSGKLTDTDVSVRSQRFGPFLFSLGSAVLGLVVLILTHAPKNLQTVLIISSVSGVAMILITLYWKISMHASSLASAITMLTALYGSVVALMFFVLIAVCWSRVVLRRHTTAQVIVGSLVSITLTTVVLAIRGV
jgi:membrane-associated phospholipid phosphatase